MNYNEIKYGKDGRVEYKLNGKFHRLDGPAIECKEYKKWYVNGIQHRDSLNDEGIVGPAIEYANGKRIWMQNGIQHRDSLNDEGIVGPAIEYANGKRIWMQNGEYHRDSLTAEGGVGPAIENPNNPNENMWYKHGKLHRVDGPASMANGESWYFEGKLHRDTLTSEGFIGPALINHGAESWYAHDKLHRIGGPAYKNGTYEIWKVDGKLHRLNGPAIYTNENIWSWYKDGVLHREPSTGPAVSESTYKSWHFEGKLHRLDGPAIEYYDGRKRWYINGVEYTEVEFNNYLNPKPDTPHNEVEIVRNDVGEDLCRKYMLNGKLHRADGPAIEYLSDTTGMLGKDEWWTLGVQIIKQDLVEKKKHKLILDGKVYYADSFTIEMNA